MRMTNGNSDNVWFKFQIVAICSVWYFSSSGQNIVNKLALESFPYPLTIALSSLLNNVLYAIPLLKLLRIKTVQISSNYMMKTIFPISFGRALAVSSAYVGLSKVPVSYAQTIKGTMPLFTVLLSRLMLNERYSTRIYVSLLPIVAGVFVASFTELQFDAIGLASSLFSTCTFAFLNILAKKVFEDSGMHPIHLLSINSQLATVILFPLWLLTDGYSMWQADKPTNPPSLHFLMLLFLSGLLSFIQNFCAFALIHQLSALSYAISNAAKRIAVIIVSLIVLQNPVTPLNMFGTLVSVIGVFIYNRVKHNEGVKRSTSPTCKPLDEERFLRSRKRTFSLNELRSSDSDVRLMLSAN
ncbi:TPT domain-containing protein [Aphelenchoides besseyi]|nr:TPT domain-containing protein [Aphelenchoides besseyi]KAI6218272.1 TPT domain-containing protein [Aphelenchoides besseyi]